MNLLNKVISSNKINPRKKLQFYDNNTLELSEVENDIKWSTQKTIIFQAGMIKLCNKENLNPEKSCVSRTALFRK